MKLSLRGACAGSLVGLALLALPASCKQASQPAPRIGPSVASASPPVASASSQPAAEMSWAVPPPGIQAPMPGEPAASALGDVRLVSETCEQNEQAVSDAMRARVEAMRADVEQAFEDWKSEVSCDAIGDSFGAGGLGLMGVGEGGGGYGEGIGLGGAVAMSPRFSVARAKSASGTNNQVASVDEADIVKNDGAYVYVVSAGALRIVEALHPRLVSVTKIGAAHEAVRELLVEGDRAVAFVASGPPRERPCTYAYDCTVGGDGSRTRIVVLDVTDRAHPRVVRSLGLSGSLIAARRIGNTVHTVIADGDAPELPTYETWPATIPQDCKVKGMDVAAVRARFTQLERDNERKIRATPTGFPTLTDRGVTRQLCKVMHTPLGDGTAFTSVVSFDMRDDQAAPTTAVVQTRPGVVFASEQGIYFAVTHRRARGAGARWYAFYDSVDEVSDVHKFHIGETPGETRYVGSGALPGHVLNQFAMDEWYGYLRVATTRGRVPDPDAESSVSVLAEAEGGNLVRVGAVEHIAPGEDLRAVRFDGDRGYIVTFKKTDPLYALDLGQPAAPKILGELKIPGFSTYLHRIDPTHLLSIGYGADDHGDFAYFDGVILQIFDVSHPTDPVLLHKEKLGTRGSSSEAATDHLAFNYFGERHLLALPMTLCEGGGDGTFGDQLTFSGLLVYDVTVEQGFRRLGGVDHGKSGVDCNTWWSAATSQVKRSIFMDDLVFSIATDRMKVQRMDSLGKDLAEIPLGP